MRIADWDRRLRAPWNRANPDDEGGPDLDVLLGPRFLTEGWGHKPVLFDWGARGEIDWVEAVRRLARTVTPDRVEHVIAEGRVAGPPDGLEPGSEARQLVVIRDTHQELAPVAQLHAAFRRTFGCPVTTGLYLNGPDAPGFPVHHDAHHVFAVQLVGEKTWWLGPPTVAWPHRRYTHPSVGPEPDQSLVVAQGHTLYLPPGVRHRAQCTGTLSVHLTLGVHAPHTVDVLEAAMADLGAHDPALREALTPVVEAGRVRWQADRATLARQLRRVADRLGSWSPVLDDGTVAHLATGERVQGAWPVREGRLVAPRVVPSDALARATAAAEGLLALDAAHSVHLRGSVLSADPHAQDVDLLAVVHGEPGPAGAACREVLGRYPAPVPWDLRVVGLDGLRTGRIGAWLQVIVAAGSVRLAGEPVWDTPPAVVPGALLAERLMAEWGGQWAQARDRPPSVERTVWLQKRALRLGGLLGMAATGQLTRHPDGCVALLERVAVQLGPLARRVRDDLYEKDTSDGATERALVLGQAVGVRWAGGPR